MHRVETLFVEREQQDHDAGGQAGGKPENIQEAISPIPVQIPERRLQVDPKHNFCFLPPGRPCGQPNLCQLLKQLIDSSLKFCVLAECMLSIQDIVRLRIRGFINLRRHGWIQTYTAAG
jgi:hypothetical protein